jgi:rhodanese-related sulfurtransferase
VVGRRLAAALACATLSLTAGCLGSGTRRIDAACREMSSLVIFEMQRDSPTLPLVDLRESVERTEAEPGLEGALQIPLSELEGALPRLQALRASTLVVFGRDRATGRAGCEALAAQGFRYVIFMSDGATGWFLAGLPPARQAPAP